MNKSVLQAKKDTVSEITSSIEGAATVAVVSYQGLTVAEMQELRRTLEKVDTSFTVYKNTLVAKSLKDSGKADMGDILQGPNGFVFSKDISAGAKALVKFSKFHDKLVIKGGLVEGKIVDKAGIVEVSKLPNKEGMLSMLLSVLQAPIRNLAYSIDQIAKANNGDTAAAN